MSTVSATSTPTLSVGADGKVTAGNLVANLDPTAIVNALMTAAGFQQVQLEATIKTEQAKVGVYQSLNTGLASIQTTAAGYLTANAMNLLTASSSDSSITASASTSATATQLTMQVNTVAASQVSVTAATNAYSGTDFTIVSSDGTQHAITAASTSPADVATAINAAGIGVSAATVPSGNDASGNPTFRLQLTSTTSGAASSFSAYEGTPAAVSGGTATNLLTAAGAATITSASDAQLTLWPGTAAAQTVTSTTNTFTNVEPGLTINVTAPTTTPATVTTARDDTSISNATSNLVSSVNQVLSYIKTQQAPTTSTAADGSTNYTPGSFTADALVSNLSTAMTSAIISPVNGLSPSTWGVNIGSDGSMTLDATKFKAALDADPQGTTTAMQTIFQRISDAAAQGSDPYTGSITNSIQSQQSQITTDQTTDKSWTTRLAAQRQMLNTEYTNLALNLSQMQNEQAYLTQQVNAMNGTSNGG